MPLRASVELGNEYFRVEPQLLCLYALPDPHLIRYYEKTLGFSRLEDPDANFIYGHIKPKYDQDCVFMCRRI